MAKMARGQGEPMLKLWIRVTRVNEEVCASPAKAICFKDHKYKVLGSRGIPRKQILENKYC